MQINQKRQVTSQKIYVRRNKALIILCKRQFKAILIVLEDIKESLINKCRKIVLYIDTDEFIPDVAELTLLFRQVQDKIKNSLCPIYIAHI